MPAERVSMRQIREVLRLRFASELPQRGIAKSLGLSQGAVSGYLSRARAAGVSWPLPADLDDEQLESLLFPPPPARMLPPPVSPWRIELGVSGSSMPPSTQRFYLLSPPRLDKPGAPPPSESGG